jgi:hypothetical protein
MDWYQNRLSQLPTQAEIDSLYFHLLMLIVAGLLLAFSVGVVLGSRAEDARQAARPRTCILPLRGDQQPVDHFWYVTVTTTGASPPFIQHLQMPMLP